jgi:membrane protease YdiL (CAAX protease family)
MAIAGVLVAAVAATGGLVAWCTARRPLLPRPGPWRVPFGGLELTMAFALVLAIQMAVASSGVPPVAVGVVALPFQFALLVVGWRALFPRWKPFGFAGSDGRGLGLPLPAGVNYPGLVAVAVLAWAVLTPVVLAVHAAVTAAFTALDLPLDEHPIIQLGGGDPFARLLFATQACFAAPLVEELMFRGLLLPWVIGARERHAGGLSADPVVPRAARPWLVMGTAVAYTAANGKPGPVIFAAVLAAGLAVLWLTVRKWKRHVRGIYATAALFGLIHSGVWPSPIPLFVLGLGLGWLAARTRGVFAPVIVHGLFNAVSVVFVLRGTG